MSLKHLLALVRELRALYEPTGRIPYLVIGKRVMLRWVTISTQTQQEK